MTKHTVASPMDSAGSGRLSWIVPPVVVPTLLGGMVLLYALLRAHA